MVDKVLKQQGGNTFPNLCGSWWSNNLSKVISNSIVFPFQVTKFPTWEGGKEAKNSMENVSKGATCFFCIQGFHNGESVKFKDSLWYVHFLGKEYSLFKSNGFHYVSLVMARVDFAQSSRCMAWWVLNGDSYVEGSIIMGGCTIYTYFVSARKGGSPT